LPKIRRKIVRIIDLSDYFRIIQMPQGFFSMLNLFLHSEMDFEHQTKNSDSYKFILPNSSEKSYFIEHLDNADLYY
jgi:hypothetical protein